MQKLLSFLTALLFVLICGSIAGVLIGTMAILCKDILIDVIALFHNTWSMKP